MEVQSPVAGVVGSSGSAAELGRRMLEAAEEAVSRWASQEAAGDGGYGVSDLAGLVPAVRDLISLASNGGAYSQRARFALEFAMEHLEDDFRQVLISSTYFHPPDNLPASLYDSIALPVRSFSFSSITNLEAARLSSFTTSSGDDSPTYSTGHSRHSLSLEKVHLYLIDPEASIVLKDIAELMMLAGYASNLSRVYGEIRNRTLMQCLCLLGIQIELKSYNPTSAPVESECNMQLYLDQQNMQMWIQALRVIVGIVFPEERQACTQIFGSDNKVEVDCFASATTRVIQQLLAFGSLITNVKEQYEKLPLLIQMHDEFVRLKPSMEAWYGNAKDVISQEAGVLLDKLREEALRLLFKLSDAQTNHESYERIVLDGSVLPFPQYTMGVIKQLASYSDTLNLILPVEVGGDGTVTMNPWKTYVLTLLTQMQLNTDDKSKSYKDERLQHIFLMNNAMYVLEKSRSPDLKILFEDRWITEQLTQVERHATAYLRASWAGALFHLSDADFRQRNDPAGRLKSFNSTFREISRVQTTWKIPNPQLRQHLRLVILQQIILAYRTFLKRFGNLLKDPSKSIKYTPEDIENHVLDLFEG
ncbi:exocyst complex component EXO70A1-like isoform X1 [Oryza brachyantha]|uniref:exocyst complex component EXO70A1-like isoform X1 n=1 Tax=Oryza brachyantha TaxID=4533 RepID=UPI001ADA7B2D|nr:exocyst complex component EXO70A1-like isoform X1 [Oryza brachyantha]